MRKPFRNIISSCKNTQTILQSFTTKPWCTTSWTITRRLLNNMSLLSSLTLILWMEKFILSLDSFTRRAKSMSWPSRPMIIALESRKSIVVAFSIKQWLYNRYRDMKMQFKTMKKLLNVKMISPKHIRAKYLS